MVSDNGIQGYGIGGAGQEEEDMTPEEEVNAAFDEVKPLAPTVALADTLEKCRKLALHALGHPCTREKAVRIWEGGKH